MKKAFFPSVHSVTLPSVEGVTFSIFNARNREDAIRKAVRSARRRGFVLAKLEEFKADVVLLNHDRPARRRRVTWDIFARG